MEEKKQNEEIKNENKEIKEIKGNNENKRINDDKKIITSFEYKKDIAQEPDVNIVLSEDKNSIIFMSLELLISELKDSNLGKSNKNINYDDILIY